MRTSYNPRSAGVARVVVPTINFCLRNVSQEKRPIGILEELLPEHSI